MKEKRQKEKNYREIPRISTEVDWESIPYLKPIALGVVIVAGVYISGKVFRVLSGTVKEFKTLKKTIEHV